MNITWITRSFLDYRVPVFAELDQLCDHHLTLIYNKEIVPERCQNKIGQILGNRSIGLSGEIRSVSLLNQRLTEISRLGFRRCVLPAHGRDEIRRIEGLQLIPVQNISEAIAAVLAREA